MPRLKPKPLRGSVRQNYYAPRASTKPRSKWIGRGMRMGALFGSVGLLLGLFVWLWHIGWPQRQADHALQAMLRGTEKAHFAIKDITVEGRQHTDRTELLSALGISLGDPILGFDPRSAHERVTHLPWVANAAIERHLPDSILVRIAERVPMARWQHENRTMVIDASGKELPNTKPESFTQLPLLVGNDAPQQAETFLDDLKDFPVIAQNMTSAVRVSERRWDIYLKPKIVAHMPESNLASALSRLARLIQDQKILSRDINAVDLRFSDRLIFEPSAPPSAHKAGEQHP